MLTLSRADRNVFSIWWWTVDRGLVAAILTLMLTGIVFSLAASPSVATRFDLDEFHFVKRQAMFMIPAICVLFSVSMLNEKYLRRLCLVVFIGGLALMLFALGFGREVKGSLRWVSIAGFNIQPSEFVKPAFVLLAAWFLSEGNKNESIPGVTLSALLLATFVGLLLLQPDIGQTMLISMVWGILYFVAGMPWLLVFGAIALATLGFLATYKLMPHVTDRVDRFLDPSSGDNYQVNMALESFQKGGWFGRGPGEGAVRQSPPDSHTDFVLAPVALDFGILVVIAVLLLFGFIIFRVLFQAFREEDPFTYYALTGLVSLFGLQALINVGVNLQLLPAKGMTLPFISAGGSSLVAMSFAMGMILALTRKKPKIAAPLAFGRTKPVDVEIVQPEERGKLD